jgi:hypothetical protein
MLEGRDIRRQYWIGFHDFVFLVCCLVSVSFHTREIVEEGVGHLQSYRKSTES